MQAEAPRLALADDGPRPGRGVPSLRHLNASGLDAERTLGRDRPSSLTSDSAALVAAQRWGSAFSDANDLFSRPQRNIFASLIGLTNHS